MNSKAGWRRAVSPVFSTDGLKHSIYTSRHPWSDLPAHFGRWEQGTGKLPTWVLLAGFLYGQVIKRKGRRRTVEVEQRLFWGEEKRSRERLHGAGLSGRINTAFFERLNPTIRQCVSRLFHRTWGQAKYPSELMEHLAWWRCYYHFVRPHESFAVELSNPASRKGKQRPRMYRKRTPAQAAGLTDRRWTVRELPLYPLP